MTHRHTAEEERALTSSFGKRDFNIEPIPVTGPVKLGTGTADTFTGLTIDDSPRTQELQKQAGAFEAGKTVKDLSIIQTDKPALSPTTSNILKGLPAGIQAGAAAGGGTTSASQAVLQALTAGASGAAVGAVGGLPGAIAGGIAGIVLGSASAYFGLKNARAQARQLSRQREAGLEASAAEAKNIEKWARINRLDTLDVRRNTRKDSILRSKWQDFDKFRNLMSGTLAKSGGRQGTLASLGGI